MKKNKILFISQYAGFIGGLERYIYAVASLLRANGFTTFMLYLEKTRESEHFLSAFNDSWNFNQRPSINEKDFQLTTLHKIDSPAILKEILNRFAPTLFVHDHIYYCPKGFKYYPYKRINCSRGYNSLFCGICSSLVPPRHIRSQGGLKTMIQKNFFLSPQLFHLARSCSSFVVLSQFMANNLKRCGIPENSIHIIPPFLDIPSQKKSIPSRGKAPAKIILAAQQVMSKGTPLFLEALSLLRHPYQAHILGTGSRLKDFISLSQQMKLENNVYFEGWVSNPQKFFIQADIGVFPSLWQEPFGLSGIEAMSFEIPVVGFNVGGTSEWLKDEFNGFLIPERNTCKMAEKIDLLIEKTELRLKLGQNARQYVIKEFDKNKFLDNFKELL